MLKLLNTLASSVVQPEAQVRQTNSGANTQPPIRISVISHSHCRRTSSELAHHLLRITAPYLPGATCTSSSFHSLDMCIQYAENSEYSNKRKHKWLAIVLGDGEAAERSLNATYRSPALLGRISVVFLRRSPLEQSQVSLPPPGSRRRRSYAAPTGCRSPLPSRCLMAAATHLLLILENGALRQHVIWQDWLQHNRTIREITYGIFNRFIVGFKNAECIGPQNGFLSWRLHNKNGFQQKLLFCISFIRNSVSR